MSPDPKTAVPLAFVHRPWADLVFHVLAHVSATAPLASSVYDPEYVAWAGSHLGPAASRPLRDDIEALSRIVSSHEHLARVQVLAWVFDDIEQARRCAARDLSALLPTDVAIPRALMACLEAGPAAEALFCAALLERPHWQTLPQVEPSSEALRERLLSLSAVAPRLSRCQFSLVRALRLRGRVFGHEISVGVPSSDLGPSAEHAAWQAAHEATVLEVSRANRSLPERQVEHLAVVLLGERCRRAGTEASHRQWLAHFGNAPEPRADALSKVLRGALRELLG